MHSADFRKLWAGQSVREKASGVKVINNRIVGVLRLNYETMRLQGDTDQGMVIYTADPGSESENGLRLLASWIAASDAPSQVRETAH